jgi:D-alanyl-D-alanine carboxypeptidase
MKHISRTLLILILLPLQHCAPSLQPGPVANCPLADAGSRPSFRKEALQQVLDNIVKEGVPGCALAVYSPEGSFTGSAGFARIEDKTPMQPCHLQYLQSVSKTYMAVAILQLYEQGKIDLDAPLTQYLPARQAQSITDASKITIRMLLAHRSGIPEYNMRPAYITKLLQHPDYIFNPVEYFQYIDGKPLNFEPGTRYTYCNTNYEILALIADAITGDHTRFITDNIFTPLQLTHTYYRREAGYLNYANLVNTYWDRYSDGIIENATVLQHNNVVSLIGDDGIVASPEDAVKFLRGLMEGKLLKTATIALMQTWSNDRNGNPTYGLGLDYTKFKDEIAYGHSGGGIGAGCQLYYFPEKKLYYFVGINLGTVTESPIHERLTRHLAALQEALLK